MQLRLVSRMNSVEKNPHLFPDETWHQYLDYDEHFTFGLLE